MQGRMARGRWLYTVEEGVGGGGGINESKGMGRDRGCKT